MSNLANHILETDSTADLSILTELTRLDNQYNINWIYTPKGVFAVMSELSIVKGMPSDDYKDHWSESGLTRRMIGASSEALAGKASKIEGEALARFKKYYTTSTGRSLGRINSLWVGDWLHSYSYLVQGKSEVAKDFQKLGASSIQQEATKELRHITEVTNHERYNFDLSEDMIQMYFIALSGFSSNRNDHLFAEQTVKDFPGSRSLTRRFDFFSWQPSKTHGKLMHLYELKKDIITLEDVVSTMLGKRYLELAKEAYKTNAITLVMVAPFGGTQEAHTKAAELGTSITTVSDLASSLINRISKSHLLDNWYMDKIEERFSILTTPPKQLASRTNKALPIRRN